MVIQTFLKTSIGSYYFDEKNNQQKNMKIDYAQI